MPVPNTATESAERSDLPTPMLLPESPPIRCPECHARIRMTYQGLLRSRERYGVVVDCRTCGGFWLYRDKGFSGLSTVRIRKRRNPKTPVD